MILWPEKISNGDYLGDAGKETWMLSSRENDGHVLCREPQTINRTARHWAPDGKRKGERPRTTWRRIVESEMKAMQHCRGSLTRLTQERQKLRNFVAALNTTGCDGR